MAKSALDQCIAAVARLLALGWTHGGGRWTRPGAWATVTASGIEARGVTAEEREAFDVLWERGTQP